MSALVTGAVQVQLGGLLGAALDANRSGRLSHFIVDENSPAIEVFGAEWKRRNDEGDWYGEHAGKWLVAAARAAARSADAQLAANVCRVADYLVQMQEDDGYLGTYAPERRFMQRQPPKPVSWDGAPSQRTWDIWTHSYLILGLLEVNRHFPSPRYLEAAQKIGDLCWETLSSGDIDITDLGNHHGMSATVLMDPAVELHFVTGEARYLHLAELILRQANNHPPLALLSRALAGADAADIATGKAYQLAWNLVGLAKLHRATGKPEYRQAVDHLWHSIREHHLSLGGGPWGGVGHRSREVFNAPGAFIPTAYVETCSTLAWIQLNRELLTITGEARYAGEIERSAYNDLLGAQAPNGEDWCYYSFPNGKRVHTTYWRCCKSSGAMALEELPGIAYGAPSAGGVAVNLYGPGEAALNVPGAGDVTLRQTTTYPFDGAISITVHPERVATFAVSLRIPAWAEHASIRINGEPVNQDIVPDTYVSIQREWRAGDQIVLDFPMRPLIHHRLHRNVQESRAPDGSPVRQEVLRYEYLAITRGPLVYATGLIDGFKSEESLRLPPDTAAEWLREVPGSAGMDGPEIELRPVGREPLRFVPYFRADGRRDGGWRLTWMQLGVDAGSAAP
ncbi:MAG TPA: beta-L-arabinofuranosidase domain-containing protein [Rhodanobacter sp.]